MRRRIYLIGVQRGDKAATAVKDLFALSLTRRQKLPDPRDYQGHKIYTVPLPGARTTGAAATLRFMFLPPAVTSP